MAADREPLYYVCLTQPQQQSFPLAAAGKSGDRGRHTKRLPGATTLYKTRRARNRRQCLATYSIRCRRSRTDIPWASSLLMNLHKLERKVQAFFIVPYPPHLVNTQFVTR